MLAPKLGKPFGRKVKTPQKSSVCLGISDFRALTHFTRIPTKSRNPDKNPKVNGIVIPNSRVAPSSVQIGSVTTKEVATQRRLWRNVIWMVGRLISLNLRL